MTNILVALVFVALAWYGMIAVAAISDLMLDKVSK